DDAQLARWLGEARARTLALFTSLSDEQLLGPQITIVNPALWEVGHVGWFAERWVLRHAGGARPILDGADALWDSSAVAHARRWSLPLPSRDGTVDFLRAVDERVQARIARG